MTAEAHCAQEVIRMASDGGSSQQYGANVVLIEETDSISNVMEFADDIGARFHDGEDMCYVVQFPGGPAELYTERALRSSMRRYPTLR